MIRPNGFPVYTPEMELGSQLVIGVQLHSVMAVAARWTCQTVNPNLWANISEFALAYYKFGMKPNGDHVTHNG